MARRNEPTYWQGRIDQAQHMLFYMIQFRPVQRLPHKGEIPCDDCNTQPGKLHVPGCQREICPLCSQVIYRCTCCYLPGQGIDQRGNTLIKEGVICLNFRPLD